MKNLDQDKAGARADFCRFLAACYYQPDPAFTEERMFDSMIGAANRLDPGLVTQTRRLASAFAAESHQDLLVDYTRLFLGPVQAIAQPYESVWTTGERTLMQDSTMAILELYGQGGFEIAEDFRELPDHIAAELEFLYLLTYRESEAQRNGEPAALAAMAGLRRRFLDEHLGRWVGPFTAAVATGAQCEFYRELAALTGRYVGMERQHALAA